MKIFSSGLRLLADLIIPLSLASIKPNQHVHILPTIRLRLQLLDQIGDLLGAVAWAGDADAGASHLSLPRYFSLLQAKRVKCASVVVDVKHAVYYRRRRLGRVVDAVPP